MIKNKVAKKSHFISRRANRLATCAGAALLGLSSVAFAQQAADYPPSAEAGQCFARVWTPEVANEVAEQVIDVPERIDTKTIPAEYGFATETIVVKEQSIRYENIPATYKTITEQVLVEPERVEKTVIPARYETYEERVLVKEAYTTWKPGGKLYGRTGAPGFQNASSADQVATSTGEILCRVEIPAEYKTVKRTRLAEAERISERTIPARYETVTRQVIDQAATTRETIIPAVTETRKVRKLITPASEQKIVIPATYKTVTKRVVSKPGTLEWQSILCDQNATTEKLQQVQSALTAAGYPTATDGQWGPSTLVSMERFQRARGLPVGYLTFSTLSALGVAP